MSIVRCIAKYLIASLLVIGFTGCSGDNQPSDDAAPDDVSDVGDDGGGDDGFAVTPEPADAGWGNLQMRFVYDGAPPKATKLDIPNTHPDLAYCSQDHPLDESLVVDAESRGLANVVIWLHPDSDDEVPEAHQSYAESAMAEVRLDNTKCRFEPRICLLRPSQKFVIGNLDTVGHNSKVTFFNQEANESFNITVGAGAKDGEPIAGITGPENVPALVQCTIHPWMLAHIVIKDHPYFGASDQHGNLVIRNLPPGKYTFRAWQEKSGYLADVAAGSSAVDWQKRGRFEVTIAEGENNVGILKVAPSNFE